MIIGYLIRCKDYYCICSSNICQSIDHKIACLTWIFGISSSVLFVSVFSTFIELANAHWTVAEYAFWCCWIWYHWVHGNGNRHGEQPFRISQHWCVVILWIQWRNRRWWWHEVLHGTKKKRIIFIYEKNRFLMTHLWYWRFECTWCRLTLFNGTQQIQIASS